MPLEELMKLGNLFGKGIISQFAPDILRGAIVELFRAEKLDVRKTTAWVEDNRNLWDGLGEERQEQFERLARKIGSIDWLNADWAINALREEHPAVASLFLGWKKSHNWLERQMEMIKKNLQQPTP